MSLVKHCYFNITNRHSNFIYLYRYSIGQTMTTDGGVNTQLNMSHVRVDDGGRYGCVAYLGDAVISHEDRVNVYGMYS